MPHFIDTSDQDAFMRDDVGADYADLGAAKAAAIVTVPDMAHDASLPTAIHELSLQLLATTRGMCRYS